ncbi:MAG TPA: glycerol kinase GlpK [Gemmatimonadaceae bacterium]|nr:glycerol kinase GlpK [Gemmatimonadaceae bacterium]
MQSVLAIDSGTTGATCLVIAADGRVLGRGYREIPQHYPEPGRVEHEPLDILNCTLDAAREAVTRAGAAPTTIGIANQRETIVLWNRDTGAPIGRAIVWQDRRTAARCAELAPLAEEIAVRTGLLPDPYFSATKLEWLLAHEEIRRMAGDGTLAAGTVDTWLIWNLTVGEVHATDSTNASRTMLYDIRTLEWSEHLLALFGVPRAILPEVRASSGDFGVARGALLGVTHDIPIHGVAGDQQAALFGQGCWAAGQGKNTYGTGAFLLLNTGTERGSPGGGLLTTVACDANGQPSYALEGAIFVAGAAVQWLRDGLGIIASAQETESLASGIASNDGVYFVPALTGLGAPQWEPAARGTIVGLTRGTTTAHLARAALEAMAYATADVLEVMQQRGRCSFDRLRVDGGATDNRWLMQFQADVLGVPVERPDMVETTALGAAGLAGIAAGVWPDASTFLGTRRFQSFNPGPGAAAARASRVGWARAVRATLSWARDTR